VPKNDINNGHDNRAGYYGKDREGRRFQVNDRDAHDGRGGPYGIDDQGGYGYRGNRGWDQRDLKGRKRVEEQPKTRDVRQRTEDDLRNKLEERRRGVPNFTTIIRIEI
jgi:hypothetical protein